MRHHVGQAVNFAIFSVLGIRLAVGLCGLLGLFEPVLAFWPFWPYRLESGVEVEGVSVDP